MRKLLLILGLIIAFGCSKSDNSVNPQDSDSVEGAWLHQYEQIRYGKDGEKIDANGIAGVKIIDYNFKKGKVVSDNPEATGTYSIRDGKMSVQWGGEFGNESFSGDLSIKSKDEFFVTERHEYNGEVDGVYVAYYILSHRFLRDQSWK